MSADEQALKDWLKTVVIGEGLCPFAAQPWHAGTVRITCVQAETIEALNSQLEKECRHLDSTPQDSLETTLIALPGPLLNDFVQFNDYLGLAENLLRQWGYEGVFQIASFHPEYQFAGTLPDDRENLTNRAPLPVLHLLREASLEAVLAHVDNPDAIYQRNIKHMQNLSDAQCRSLFPYLFKS